MPGLYGLGNANVTTSVGNTTGLYIGSGAANILNSAEQLLSLLSNVGTVGFSLTAANTQVLASVLSSGVTSGVYGADTIVPQITVGGDGRVTSIVNIPISGALGSYGNANVAAFLPTYGGTINSFTIFNDSGFAIQGRDYTQMQFTNGVTPPASEYDIGVGAWFYIDAGGGVFQSNTTGNLKTILYGHDATITADGNIAAPYFIGNGSKLTNLPSGSNYGNANVAVYLPYDPTITGLQANIGGSQTYANVTFATKSALQTLNANLGAFETYANATFGTSSYGNANVAVYLPYNPTIYGIQANIGGSQTYANVTFATKTALQTLDANVGAFETYANATFGTSSYGNTQAAAWIKIDPTITALQANVGAFETYANLTFSTTANAASQQTQIDTLNANVGAFETYGNLTFATKSALQVVDANLGTATTNITTLFSNAATQATAINTLNANLGAFETYANLTFGTSSYSNVNVAAYLNTSVTSIQSPAATSLFVQGNDGLTLTGVNTAALTSGTGGIATVQALDGLVNIYGGNTTVAGDSSATRTGNLILPKGYVNANGTVTGTGFYFYANGVNILTAVATKSALQTLDANVGAFETYANATFVTSTGSYGNANVASYILDNGINTGTSAVIIAQNLTDVSDASTAPVTGALIVKGGASIGKSVKIFGTANVGNVITGGGIFWANGVNYSTTIATTAPFTGNLAGNILYDGINGRIFANASPLSAPSTSNQASTSTITNIPVYTGGILQQPATGNQTTGMVLSSNVSLQSKYDAVNKNTVGTYQYLQVWPSTANNMTNSDRVRGGQTALDVQLNGKQWFSSNISNSVALVGAATGVTILGTGSAGHTVGQFNFVGQTPTGGSANIGFATGSYSLIQTATTGTGYTASNIGVARLFSGCVIVAGNLSITNAVGLHTVNGWGSTATNKYALLNEDTATTITTNGNIVQAGFAPALTATFSNVAYTGSMSPGFQFTANTSGSLTGNVFYLGNVNYASLQQVSLDSNISVVATTSATARQFDFLVFSYGTKTITWPTNSTVYGSIIPNSTTYAKVTQYGSTSSVTVAYTQDPSVWYSNVNAQSYTLSNVVLNAYAEKQVSLGTTVSGTVTINNSQGPVQTMTLTGSITINTANMSNFVTGKSVTLIITQGGSGSYTLTSDIKFAGASKTLSTAVGAIDTITIYYDGTNYLASLVKGYA